MSGVQEVISKIFRGNSERLPASPDRKIRAPIQEHGRRIRASSHLQCCQEDETQLRIVLYERVVDWAIESWGIDGLRRY